MIPLTLHIKNFLSYGPEPQTIDFSGYPLICLSGKNGHGKSALLDAITWALWGQARKVADIAKADEGLVRLGQTNMLVMLDFEFNGQTYRVRREFNKAATKTVANLDFGILDTAANTVIPLTEKTIRATQAKIEQMLNLDAESFINSAFLRQGQSNEFSKKSAKERKEILATILGLTRYESLRKIALERSKQALAEKQALATLQQALEQHLATAPALTTNLAHLTERLAEIHKHELAYAQEKNTLEAERTSLVHQQQQGALLTHQKEQLEAERAHLLTKLHETRTQWRSTHRYLLTLTDRTPLEAQKKELLDAIALHQKMLQKNLELKEQLLTKKEQVTLIEQERTNEYAKTLNNQKLVVERAKLEKESCEKKIIELQAHINTCTRDLAAIAQEAANLEKQLSTSKQIELHATTVERQFEKRKAYYQKFITHGNWLKNELAALEQKKLLVHDDDNPSCPLCEQNLSASRKKFIKTSFAKQEQIITHQLKRLSSTIKRLKELLVEQHGHLTQVKKERDALMLATARTQELKTQQEKITTQHTTHTQELVTLQKNYSSAHHAVEKEDAILKTLEHQQTDFLTKHGPYLAALMAHKTVEQDMITLAYQPQEHAQARDMLAHVETQLHSYANVQEQLEVQKTRLLETHQLISSLKKIKKDHADIVRALHPLALIAEKEQTLRAHEENLAHRITANRTNKEQVLQEKGNLENQQATMHNHAQEHKKNSASVATLTTTIQEYQAIAAATGKDGIQALLIEDAIPEIEHEANQLLAKLTNNQAHIIIESQRDLKKGGAKETLDIKISDPMGIRPYELFSGGEAFRIDFALRVAISKLLTRRAGTSLQTLIIDEGFGSQDEEGLNHIMDAMYKIQDDFSKIIIVSHLSTMKDQFPVHFHVEKGPNGSRVQVIEQG